MTSPNRFQPVGPVNVGDSVGLVSYINGQFYVGMYDTLHQDIAFYWFLGSSAGEINPRLDPSTIVQFTVTGTLGAIKLDAINTQARGGRLLSKLATNTPILSVRRPQSTMDSIVLTSEYSTPPPPGMMYASVNYTPSINNFTLSIPYYPAGSNSLTYTLSDVWIIPSVIHARNDGDASTFTCTAAINDVFTSLRVFVYSACGGANCGSVITWGQGLPRTAWTRLSDCQTDNPYSYCKAGQTCGTCYGPCSSQYQTCQSAAGSPGQKRNLVCTGASTQPLSPLTPPSNVPVTPITPGTSQPLQPVTPSGTVPSTLPTGNIVPVTPPSSSWIWIVIIVIVILIILGAFVLRERYYEPVHTHQVTSVLSRRG